MGGTAFCKQITVRGGVPNCFWLFWTNLPLFCLLTSLELIVNFKKCTITGNARAFLAALKGTVQQYFASYLNQKYILGLFSSSDTVPLNVRAALSDFNVYLTATYIFCGWVHSPNDSDSCLYRSCQLCSGTEVSATAIKLFKKLSGIIPVPAYI